MNKSDGRQVSKPHLQENVNFIMKEVKNVCRDIGPREPGSEHEKKAHDYFANLMAQYSDTVEIEGFQVSPRAFMGWVVSAGLFMMLSVALFALSYFNLPDAAFVLPFRIAAIVLSCLSIFLMLGEFFFYKEVTDRFAKKATSHNTICKRAPSGELKKRIIFCGHMDSAYEWRFTHLGGSKLLKTIVIPVILFAFVCLGLDIASLYLKSQTALLGFTIFEIASALWFFAVLFMCNWKKVVTGALDDLTGVYTSAAVMRYMSVNDIRFENTELCVLATGSEEAGLRGSKYFAKAHKDEMKDVETVCVCLDTLGEIEHIGINAKDMSGLVKVDKRVCSLLQTAAGNKGYDIPLIAVALGATDAAAMTQQGIPAACITAMDSSPARYYHTRADLPELMKRDVLEETLSVCIESAFLFDEQGLKETY